MEEFLRADAKITRAVSRMRANCWARSGDRSGIVGIIKKGCPSFAVRCSSVAFVVRCLVAGDFRGQGLAEPIFDRCSHLLEPAFEEVISGIDPYQLFRVGEGVDERFEFTGGTELVARSADEEFRFGASAQK